jgi:phospholipid/cholesterol/gamma-HCH transport system substrate-binding protein
MFILIGLVAFTSTIYFVENRKISLALHFKFAFQNVSGLEVGNNVLFSE